jgi:hypothetical protein
LKHIDSRLPGDKTSKRADKTKLKTGSKKYLILLLTCLVFSMLIVSFYLYSRNSDKTGKTEVMTSAQDSNKTSSDFGPRGGEAGQGAAPESGTDSNSGQESANHPPTIDKANWQFESSNNRDIIKVVAVGSDKDNDPVTFEYEWFRNGEPAGNGDTLSEFRREDRIVAKVTPYDGKDHGTPKSLSVEIANSTPKITGYKEIKFDGNNWAGRITASDPDGDTLAYSLKSAPSSMTIDSSTGMVKWTVPADFKGIAPFKVSVSDGHGGEVSQDLAIDIALRKK